MACCGLCLDVSDGSKEVPVTRHLQSYHHFYFLMYIAYIRKYYDGEKEIDLTSSHIYVIGKMRLLYL
jgi:hypothetical protein